MASLIRTLSELIIILSTVMAVLSQSSLEAVYFIDEELSSNDFIGDIASDSGLSSVYDPAEIEGFRYGMLQGKYNEYFVIDESTSVLRTSDKVIDREELCLYKQTCELELSCAITHPLEYFKVIKVIINVEDVNDNQPKFELNKLELNISESVPTGSSNFVPIATDLDTGIFSVRDYHLDTPSSVFELSVTTNVAGSKDLRLILKRPLDRETEAHYTLSVVAEDGGSPPRRGILNIEVNVIDANDNSPVFDHKIYNITVPENYGLYSPIVQVHARDRDAGNNGKVLYKLFQQTANQYGHLFGINNTSGQIYLKSMLDYEQDTHYELVVEAFDQGPDSLPSQAQIKIMVIDVNDFSPEITVNALTSTGQPEISEWAEIGTFVAHVSVRDLDRGSNGMVECELRDNNFSLQPLNEGEDDGEYKLVTVANFDYEVINQYTISIECTDLGRPSLKTTKDVVISLKDENDHAPEFEQDVYTISIRENNTISEVLLQVKATDKDGGDNGDISYSLFNNADGMVTIDEHQGIIKTNAIFDREMIELFVFLVIAEDHGNPPQSASATVTVTLIDINDEAPAFSLPEYSFGTYENQPIGTEIGVIIASDPDTPPFNDFKFSLDPEFSPTNTFDVDPDSGKITTKKVLDREHQPAYYLVAVATNTALPRLSSTVSVTIFVADKNDHAPLVVFPTPNNNSVQVSAIAPVGYTFTRIIATDADVGDNAKLSYEISEPQVDDLFAVDQLTGAVEVNKKLNDAIKDIYQLIIIVKDHGDSPKTAYANLHIRINKTLPYYPKPGTNNPHNAQVSNTFGFLGYHQKIIIILGCVTAVLVIILLTAIILIRRRQIQQMKKEEYNYMCRVDLAQKLGSDPDKDDLQNDLDSNCSDIGLNSCQEKPSNAKKSVSFNDSKESDEHTVQRHDGYIGQSKNHLTLEDLQRVRCLYREVPNKGGRGDGTPNTLPRPGGAQLNHQGSANIPTRQEIEVHQLLQFMKDGSTDGDSASAASNADSGRGTSEAGDQTSQRVPDINGFYNTGPLRPMKGNSFRTNKLAKNSDGKTASLNRNNLTNTNIYSTPQKPAPSVPNRQSSLNSTGCHGNQPSRTKPYLPPPPPHPGGKTCDGQCCVDSRGRAKSKGYSSQKYLAPPSRMHLIGENEDNVSDSGGSTTSGSYVVDLDNHVTLKSVDV